MAERQAREQSDFQLSSFTIAPFLRHSDLRDYAFVRAVEDTKRVAVEAIKLSARKNVQVLVSGQNSQRRVRLRRIKYVLAHS